LSKKQQGDGPSESGYLLLVGDADTWLAPYFMQWSCAKWFGINLLFLPIDAGLSDFVAGTLRLTLFDARKPMYSYLPPQV
jgi:hypothetical protein